MLSASLGKGAPCGTQGVAQRLHSAKGGLVRAQVRGRWVRTLTQSQEFKIFLVTMIPSIVPFMPTIQQIIQEFYLRCLLLHIRGNPSFPYYIP